MENSENTIDISNAETKKANTVDSHVSYEANWDAIKSFEDFFYLFRSINMYITFDLSIEGIKEKKDELLGKNLIKNIVKS
jgi:hypothetical protein